MKPLILFDFEGTLATHVTRTTVAGNTRLATAEAVLCDGMLDVLTQLHKSYQLGIATSKSRAGLIKACQDLQLAKFFTTLHTPDNAPPKPHPQMVFDAMTATDAQICIMIGDTTTDMQMARSANIPAIGVAWGNHNPAALRTAGATAIVSQAAELPGVIGKILTNIAA